jgi:hypothetical protein
MYCLLTNLLRAAFVEMLIVIRHTGWPARMAI